MAKQSKEAQKNARIHQAYLTLREVAGDGHANHRCYSVASTSDPRTHYTLTWDTDTDYTHCSCDAGKRSRDCVHQAAMRRLIAAIHAGRAEARDEAARVARQAEQRRMDTALLARDQRPFSLLAR